MLKSRSLRIWNEANYPFFSPFIFLSVCFVSLTKFLLCFFFPFFFFAFDLWQNQIPAMLDTTAKQNAAAITQRKRSAKKKTRMGGGDEGREGAVNKGKKGWWQSERVGGGWLLNAAAAQRMTGLLCSLFNPRLMYITHTPRAPTLTTQV